MVIETKTARVRLVLNSENQSWIIEKMAQRLADLVSDFGMIADIADQPDPAADINHWMSYAFANVQHKTPATMLITHLDDPYKIRLVKGELVSGVNVGICLSSHTRDMLIAQGVEPASLAWVVPGHDFVASPRRIVIGITTRLYPDGRKREAMLVKLASKMRLDGFAFRIFGQGWEDIVPVLESSGAQVTYQPGSRDYVADYREIAACLPELDYYLYLGRDEGSLGTLDALAAGVRTIVSPQGFHVDLPNGITHAFWSQDDLESCFKAILAERDARVTSVADCTWKNYARDHAIIWRAILSGNQAGIDSQLSANRNSAIEVIPARGESALDLFSRYFSPYRIRSALSHIPLLKPIRRLLRSR